jgi:hypothetical protein
MSPLGIHFRIVCPRARQTADRKTASFGNAGPVNYGCVHGRPADISGKSGDRLTRASKVLEQLARQTPLPPKPVTPFVPSASVVVKSYLH